MATQKPKKPAAAAADTPAPKPTKSAKPAAPKPAAVSAPAAKPASPRTPPLRLKALIETVAQSTGTKKAAVKPTVEATLAAIAAAIHSGTDLMLPPLGKLRVAKTAGEVTTLKLRKIGDRKADGKPLAEDGEDD